MKHMIIATAAALLLTGGAYAQTAAPGTGTPSTAAPTTTAPMTAPPMTAPSTAPMMSPGANAGTPPRPTAAMPSTSPAPAAVSSAANPRTTAAPVPGANSFTMREARTRIGRAGYTGVQALKKDNAGIWRGTAMKDGKSVPVALDYQGNVVSQ